MLSILGEETLARAVATLHALSAALDEINRRHDPADQRTVNPDRV
jgi:hypothetical protein